MPETEALTPAAFVELLERESAWFQTLMRLWQLAAFDARQGFSSTISRKAIKVMLTDRTQHLRN